MLRGLMQAAYLSVAMCIFAAVVVDATRGGPWIAPILAGLIFPMMSFAESLMSDRQFSLKSETEK